MGNTNSKLAIILLLITTPVLLSAQEISDFSYKIVANKIEVTYALAGDTNDRYDVRLYNSLDDYTKPLSLVTGEVGKNIIPDKNKKIIWDAKVALGEYKGNLSLKLRASFIPFITFQIKNGTSFKRAKPQLIKWTSENKQQNIKLELYQNNNKISNISTVRSGTEHNWTIPKNIKPAKNYKVKGSSGERFALSETFSVKRKISVIIWSVPVIIVAGVVVGITGTGTGENGDKSIVDPIGPN